MFIRNSLGIDVYVGDYPDECGDVYINNRSKTLWVVDYAYDAIAVQDYGDCKLYHMKRIGHPAYKYVSEEELKDRYTKRQHVMEVTIKDG